MVEKSEECSVYFQNHKQVIIDNVENFLSRQAFVDMTLVCSEGKKIKVHRAVLAACSPYFEDILLDIESQHYPVLILNDIPEGIMTLLLKFIYKGKTNIPRNLKQLFLKIAKQLQIRGLEHEVINTSQDEYSASLTNRQNSEGIESSATNSAGLISAVRGHQEQSRKLPLKIITDTGEKVINPFAIKQIQANKRESDSSSTEDDLYKPNPSKPPNEKVAVSSEVPNTINDDSDIELIEDNPSIIVLNDTQNTTNTQWFSKSQSKRSLAKKNIPSDLDYESDDSEVVASLPKRRKSPIESEFGPSPIKPSPNQSSENKADQNLSESSQSPELLTPFGNKEVAGAIISKLKEENSNSCTDSEFMEQSYESLAQFCVICRQYKKNLGHHVKRFHSVSLKMSFTCKTCSKMFYMKHTLDVHKCKSNKE